ncbi:MAG: hypothetical protein ACXIUO_07320 [Erythrobacter sp.]
MAAIETLFARLETAHRRHAQEQSEGARYALEAVIAYLREAGATPGQILPLSWLAHDMIAKPVGRETPVFNAGREGLAVAAVDALKDSGLKLATALAEVTSAMGGAMTETQLEHLRENIRRTRKRTPARKQYDDAKRALAEHRQGKLAGAPVLSWRAGVIAMVAESYGLKNP